MRDVASAVGSMGGAKMKKPPKVIDHIRIHPAMLKSGPGLRVATHYTALEHEPSSKEFGMTDGSGFKRHIQSITGMPMDSEGETATPEEDAQAS